MNLKNVGLILTFALLALGCPSKVTILDPEVAELVSALKNSPAHQTWFEPPNASDIISLERSKWRRTEYDAMLHIEGIARRTASFRRVGASWELLHEQVILNGPSSFEGGDGLEEERLVLDSKVTYERGTIKAFVRMIYTGNDQQLESFAKNSDFLAVKNSLCKWGYENFCK